jgi:hypothetical protein
MSRQERPKSIFRLRYCAIAIVLYKCCYGGESVSGGDRVGDINTGNPMVSGGRRPAQEPVAVEKASWPQQRPQVPPLRSLGFPVENRDGDELHAALGEETPYLRESP